MIEKYFTSKIRESIQLDDNACKCIARNASGIALGMQREIHVVLNCELRVCLSREKQSRMKAC